MFKFSNKNKGFTLVESLVTIFIIIVLSLIILPNYYSTKQQLALQRSAFKLAQDIRTIQEMAMSVQEFGDEIPAGGYGIYLRKVPSPYISYSLYVDKNNNQKYDFGEEKIEEINLESGLKILSLDENQNHINIIFTPPDPEVYLLNNDAEELGSEVIIVICLSDDESKTKTVTINKAGLIYVE